MTVLSSHSCASVTGLRPAGASGRGPNPRAARSGVLLMVLAVTLSALGVGCSDGTEATSDAEVEPSGFGKEVTLPISAAVATLVTPGEEPHSQLRPAVRPGTSQQVTLRTDHHLEQQIYDGLPNDFSSPTIEIPLTAHAGRDGVDLTVGTATSPDPTLAEQLLHADGSHVGFVMSDAGAITRLSLTTTPDTPEAARAALERALVQVVYHSLTFPAEPVGPHAVWTVHQQVVGDLQPNEANQVTTATLTRREGNVLTIALDITQTPKSTEWQLPNNTGSLDIVNYVMRGTGTIVVDLGLPLPVAGSVTIDGGLVYRESHSGGLLRQDISTRVQWGG
ncbi:hypothetical protein [Nocardia sp. MDA0666]|uniref:hypothetical protein n=1 Tax=Nocardia sp. MDA0666 TaxID=2135448 RepID=UPI001E328E82|nr:hypothetical protein [Nocardia sp. MDA0666]